MRTGGKIYCKSRVMEWKSLRPVYRKRKHNTAPSVARGAEEFKNEKLFLLLQHIDGILMSFESVILAFSLIPHVELY